MITYIAAGIFALLLIIFLVLGYTKAPPDTAVIISGLRKKPKVLIGRAGIVIPFLERKDKLSLRQITIDIKTDPRNPIPTKDYINITVDAVAKVRVLTDPDKIELAMRNFLNKKDEAIALSLQDSLQGNMREIIGSMALETICQDRKAFGDQVQEKANADMNSLGIEIISCNIQNISDENGLIKNMGEDNTQTIKKNAAIAKANAERDVAVAQAEAQKAANDARVKAETEIAQRNTELEMRKAELKREADAKKAVADAAYQIQAETQRRDIETERVNADIAKEERKVLLNQQQAKAKEMELDAEIRKKADADKYAAEKQAEAELVKRQKAAEAERYEQEQKAQADKAKAEAEKYAAEQRAEGILKVGEAEAAAIRAKLLAEAEGIEKKAEAMQKMGQASVLEMLFKAYPEIMAAAARPLEKVDKITMYGDGNSTKMISDIVNTTTKVISGLQEATGLDVSAMISGFLGGKLGTSNSEASQSTLEDCKVEKEDTKQPSLNFYGEDLDK